MEAQTLQQQVPVYHVCQQCNGAGCQACSDLMILDGDIQLDPEWVDELPEPSPINGVIGISRETIPQRVARYNSGRNRLLALRMQRASTLNPDLYCPRCHLSKASYQTTCSRATCEAAK
ncbi:hypothetical protein ODY53_21115 [Aeromonas veronii]|uniref:hypothetical protein n=1 Tax=Aeromonas veronii TaxID=654 RepID=UPI002247884B|nr:hypothetical protein [Aeromonas veronii]MCX0424883.1 hypothetical protein [Aeromonas veronii]